MIKASDPRFAHFTPEMDAKFLRRAMAVAEEAQAAGNHPFGCLLVDLEGNILMEQGNIEVTGRVCTGHAETTLGLHPLYQHRTLLHVLRRRLLGQCRPHRLRRNGAGPAGTDRRPRG